MRKFKKDSFQINILTIGNKNVYIKLYCALIKK